MINDLGNLFSDNSYNKALNLKGVKKKDLIIFFKKMLLIRKVEEEVARLIKNKIINCPCHLCIGQEAVSVGLLSNFKKGDVVFGNHRSHGHYLSLGGNLKKFFFELQGKKEGCSKGMGGSMHLIDKSVGFEGSAPIVAGTVPLAVGAALDFKIRNKNLVSYAFFGDGACEEGVVHECLNFASTFKLPVIFVIENNLFSSHLDLKDRQPSNSMSRFAKSNKIKNYLVDGNDVVKLHLIIKKEIEKVREGKGPLFIECITYRWLGHVGPNEDIDVGILRSKKLLEKWKKKDPIKRLSMSLHNNKILSSSIQHKIEKEITNKIKKVSHSTTKVKIDKNINYMDFI